MTVVKDPTHPRNFEGLVLGFLFLFFQVSGARELTQEKDIDMNDRRDNVYRKIQGHIVNKKKSSK